MNTPESRAAFLAAHGPAAYNRVMQRHRTASIVTTVAGHPMRPVSTPFGELMSVGDTGKAFRTMAEAAAYASANPCKGA